jgi:hypothetical protein
MPESIVKPIGDDAIVTSDVYGDGEVRDMCEVRFSPELEQVMSDEEMFELAEEMFAKLRAFYIDKL